MTEKEQTALKNLIDGLREQFQPYDKVEQIQADMMELQQRANKTSEGGILLLTGPSRSGKSKLLKDHALRFPRQPRAILFEEKQWFDRVPVLIMDVPDTNTKNLTERFLAKLLGTTTRDVKNAGNSRFIITEDIAEIVKQREVRLTIFDEAHQGIDTKSSDRIKETATVFKDFSNYGTNSLVVAGTDRVLRLIDASPEFAGRVLYDHELTPFRIDHPQEWATFLDLLDVIDDYLRDNVFGKKSGLIKKALSEPFTPGSRPHRPCRNACRAWGEGGDHGHGGWGFRAKGDHAGSSCAGIPKKSVASRDPQPVSRAAGEAREGYARPRHRDPKPWSGTQDEPGWRSARLIFIGRGRSASRPNPSTTRACRASSCALPAGSVSVLRIGSRRWRDCASRDRPYRRPGWRSWRKSLVRRPAGWSEPHTGRRSGSLTMPSWGVRSTGS